ncbi:asparagine synthase (glutamine-hydrolyzing) [Coleofasciculus sp. FACHB-T130]|uniref:asparagine synthase (glutamine-hydrolyzing) n=1 Tax=Cyanophyceae TaxID=3028117 RepID=UPI00168424AD|nr:asparagine synthase (glutamine-hydrolyzing) [Coleofasciculus sp. FACHB-T130]MBD1878440.1 asparagine synthase (glutamine-hydrolyzing) [Coleofasciculus sp. FACHB-T130]
MCGITGFWDISRQKSALEMQAIARKMSDALLHRGPDDGGAWVDAAAGIALGHRRLAIVDLSPQGHQPMVSANGRYIIVFNGEIYNFLDLRRELERLGHRFRGGSDTEVMLAAFTEWGLQQAVQQFNGMFAFALWDCQERVLHLCRDRLGEKPLYYGWMGKTLLFGSELKALKAYPHFHCEINRDALALFVRHNYIPTPYSIYQGIYKLAPATVLTWNGGENRSSPIPYWSAKQIAESGVTNSFAGSEAEAAEKLETLLQEAVKLRMMADVPLGAFLSGGIDSSTIVAMMQRVSSQPVKTFTIGFYENSYNEAAYAKAVAQHLGTDHTELYVTAEEALAVIPKLPTLYDEPFSDSSQIPTFLVSQLARQQVSVALSGDGGDELFGGYNRYFLVSKIWQQIGWIPPTMRQVAADALTNLSPDKWNQAFSYVDSRLPAQLQHPNPGDKIHKLAEILAMPNPEAIYRSFLSHWKNPEVLVIGSREPPTVLSDRQQWANLPSFMQRMMYLDTVTYLPDDILVKVDRASMGVALEARVPLLDRHLVEFALRLPLSMKINKSGGKWLLREILCKYVPRNLIERPKMGFGVPIDRWLRGSLRDWAEELLSTERLQREGYFNPQPIRQKWKEHIVGDRNWQYYLWDVLMFQAWLDA